MNSISHAQASHGRHGKKRFEISTETLPQVAESGRASKSQDVSRSTKSLKSEVRHSAFAEVLNENPNEIPFHLAELPGSKSMDLTQVRLQPRTAGSGVCKGRNGKSEPELSVIGFLRDYPRMKSPDPLPKSRFSAILHRSTSERNLLGPAGKKINSVAAKRTSHGRLYGQLDLEGYYDMPVEAKNVFMDPSGVNTTDESALGQNPLLWRAGNASTYRVNEVEDPAKRKKKKKTKKQGSEVAAETSEKSGAASGLETRRTEPMGDHMGDNINVNRGNSTMQSVQANDQVVMQEPRSVSPAPILPLQEAVQSKLAIDFTSILQKHRDATTSIATPRRTKRTSFAISTRTNPENRPTVRDWAFSQALRRNSKSPMKGSPRKKSPSKSTSLDQGSSIFQHQRPNISSEMSNHDHDALGPLSPAEVLVPDLEPMADMQGQSPRSEARGSTGRSAAMRYSAFSNRHTKSPSVMSVDSIIDGNWSEVSSAIVSDAQSVLMSRPKRNEQNGWVASKPIKPGPAPVGPLPSLPEVQNNTLVMTSSSSDLSQKISTPQRSPTKPRGRPSHKYTLTPTKCSPVKVTVSPKHTDVMKQPEKSPKKPSALMRVHNTKIGAFPSPPSSPEKTKPRRKALNSTLRSSSSAGDSDDPRTERTKSLKQRDLARERSQKAVIVNDPPPPLPELQKMHEAHQDAFGADNIQPRQRQASMMPDHNAHNSEVGPQPPSSKNLPEHEDRISTSSRGLSPIIVVANQEPNFSTGSYSHSSLDDDGAIDIATPPPQPLASPLSFSHELEDASDPSSIPPIEVPAKSPYRLITNRIPTPGHLKASSYRSSQRSSLIEPGDLESRLEARMAAMEKKNVLLERAFLAVMDASASISSSGDGSRGRMSGFSVTGTETLDGRNSFSGRGSGGLETYGAGLEKIDDADRLFTELEKRLGQRGSRRLSVCSGP